MDEKKLAEIFSVMECHVHQFPKTNRRGLDALLKDSYGLSSSQVNVIFKMYLKDGVDEQLKAIMKG